MPVRVLPPELLLAVEVLTVRVPAAEVLVLEVLAEVVLALVELAEAEPAMVPAVVLLLLSVLLLLASTPCPVSPLELRQLPLVMERAMSLLMQNMRMWLKGL